MPVQQLTSIEHVDIGAKFREITRRAAFQALGNELDPFDIWIDLVANESRTTKVEGDLFERFCVEVFAIHLKMPKVWVLSEIPADVRESLSLKKSDLGIDLVAQDKDGCFHAIQAKFRRRRGVSRRWNRGLNIVPWRELSTFIALATRTGPYKNYWVVTSGDGIRRVGRRTPKDRSICYRTLRSLSSDFWQQISGMRGQTLGCVSEPVAAPVAALVATPVAASVAAPVPAPPSHHELRELRIAYYTPAPDPIPDDDPIWDGLDL